MRGERYSLLRNPRTEKENGLNDVNQVVLVGVAGEAEHKTTARGRSFAVVPVEVSIPWSNRAGQQGERVSVVPVTCWGRTLPACGERVRVEGRIASRPYTGRDGVERVFIDVVADSVTPLDAHEPRSPAAAASESRRGATTANPAPGAPLDGDIPF